MDKLTSQQIAEYSRYFHPATQVVDKLPSVDTMKGKDNGEVLVKDGKNYTKYQFINGAWHNAGTLTKV
jgi:hypothetical protein